MDNARFVLVVFFFFLSAMLYQQWQIDYGPKPAVTSPVAGNAKAPDVPGIQASNSGQPASAAAANDSTALESHQRIHVETDVVRLEIDTEGGDIRVLELKNYPVSKDHPDQPVHLFTDQDLVFIAQNGLIGDEGTSPNHHTVWKAASQNYTLAEGQDVLRIPLSWTNGHGVEVSKVYILKRGLYDIGLEHTIHNNGSTPLATRQYVQLQRKDPGDKNKDQFVRTYTGGVLFTPEEKYKKISFKDMASENLDKTAKDGWVAMIQHYFAAAWIPAREEDNGFYTKALADNHFVIGSYGPTMDIAPGTAKTLTAELFAGPKLQRVLEATAQGLDLTVDYGALTIIAKPIFWLLEQFHKIFNNWGLAIILVTLTLKALFFRLSAASYRSMANMRKLQPKMAELKEKFGSDRQKLNHAMMELYKKEKVNPLGGCLPILVQIPVFISLYWVLIETVEMRQAPFVGWLTDLSAKDPYFILPVLMGISMFIQQRLSPPPADPLQARIMQFFPIMFTGFFAFFPSGLVLYWVVNNALSILQQWYINKTIGAQVAKA
jgi:YidC/Oxa1 family membrane protein insertase